MVLEKEMVQVRVVGQTGEEILLVDKKGKRKHERKEL